MHISGAAIATQPLSHIWWCPAELLAFSANKCWVAAKILLWKCIKMPLFAAPRAATSTHSPTLTYSRSLWTSVYVCCFHVPLSPAPPPTFMAYVTLWSAKFLGFTKFVCLEHKVAKFWNKCLLFFCKNSLYLPLNICMYVVFDIARHNYLITICLRAFMFVQQNLLFHVRWDIDWKICKKFNMFFTGSVLQVWNNPTIFLVEKKFVCGKPLCVILLNTSSLL